MVDSEATYLLWLDCSKITQDTDIFLKKLRKETGLFLSLGSIYGGNGKCFARMNLACPRATVLDGLHRLEKGVH